MNLLNQTYYKARNFIYRNARPLELALWKYHFENGSKEEVLHALSFFQNEDGGFGHALEADSWNPNSVPIQTWAATEILREIDFTDAEHPLVQGILKYLESGQDFDGHFWYAAVPGNNDYPHAPWWQTEENSIWSYNPTAALSGFLVRYAKEGSSAYELGCRLVKEAYDFLMHSNEKAEGVTGCYISLLVNLQRAGKTDIIDLEMLAEKLKQQVKEEIWQKTEDWELKYVKRPSWFLDGKNSIFYADNKELADYECDFLLETQLEDGSWNLSWSWAEYPDEWALSKNWWKAQRIIQNLLYLRGMGRF